MNVPAYIGLPYSPQLNCWELIRKFASEQLNLHFKSYFYDIEILTNNSTEIIAEQMNAHAMSGWVKKEVAEIGDVLIFVIAGRPTHCGIYIGDGLFLHTLKGHNSTVESLSDWQSRLSGIFAWKN